MTTAVRERPILFSAPMVRALLDGRKTQTRRIITATGAFMGLDLELEADRDSLVQSCRFGVPGDRLWVREAWALYHDTDGASVVYRADTQDHGGDAPPGTSWRSPIHMPRDASRLTLELIDVRVQRVQDISEEDAIAEGFTTQLCEEVFDAAARPLVPEDAFHVRSDDEDFGDGYLCRGCAAALAKKHKKKGAYICNSACPESDGPAYCDCHQPLLMSLTQYGVERELFLERFGDDPEPNNIENFPCNKLDAAIAGMIAGGIGDLQEQHKPRLAKIGFATLWDSINGHGSWAANPWVWALTFTRAHASPSAVVAPNPSAP